MISEQFRCIDDNSHAFTATVFEDSNPVVGVLVSFSTNFGEFDSIGSGLTYKEVKTNSNGKASVTVYSNSPGIADIRAWLDDGDEAYEAGEITDSPSTKNWVGPGCDLTSVTLTNDGPATFPDTRIKFTANVSGTALGALKYEWDFDGDGSVDRTTTDDNVVYHDYGEAGRWRAKVTVTDLGIRELCAVSDASWVKVHEPELSAHGVARCGYWSADFSSDVKATYFVRVKLDGDVKFEKTGSFTGKKEFYRDWDLWGTGERKMRIKYWVKVGEYQVGDDERWNRDCGTPPPGPTPTPTPVPTPTVFVEVLGVEKLPVTGAVAPFGRFSESWLSVIGLLLIASGGLLRWINRRE